MSSIDDPCSIDGGLKISGFRTVGANNAKSYTLLALRLTLVTLKLKVNIQLHKVGKQNISP